MIVRVAVRRMHDALNNVWCLVHTKYMLMRAPVVEKSDELRQDGVERVLKPEKHAEPRDVRQQRSLHHHRRGARPSPVPALTASTESASTPVARGTATTATAAAAAGATR